MKTNIYIPDKINVGYQNRNGTYTGKLAYIIYWDEKGVLRKEKSWQSWRDSKIEPDALQNKPTSGFVLNKKAGGYSSGWNHRQTYCRVYDPRGFEFEITIPNLLFILENTNSIKGKGLDGDFVYGWDGKDLVLLPCSSPDYSELMQYAELKKNHKKFKGKDLSIGGKYMTKDGEEVIYLGRFQQYNGDGKESNAYFYYNRSNKYRTYETIPINKIYNELSNECDSEFADLMDGLEKSGKLSKRDKKRDEYVDYTVDDFKIISSQYCTKIFIEYEGELKPVWIRSSRNRGYYTNNNLYDLMEKDSYWGYGFIQRYSLESIYKEYKPKYLVTYDKSGNKLKEFNYGKSK